MNLLNAVGCWLPILMYHRVDHMSAGSRYPGNYVAPAEFERQLSALLEWGYRTITLDTWLAYREGRGTIPRKPIVLTFDDGYACFATHAWPVLRRHACAATVFIVTGQVGGTNAWDCDERQAPLLGSGDIARLRHEGVMFGSHTITHPRLRQLSAACALREMRESRLALEGLLQEPVTALSYPYSNQDRQVAALAAEAGYRVAVTGRGRLNTPRTSLLALRRIRVGSGTTLTALRWKLRLERALTPW